MKTLKNVFRKVFSRFYTVEDTYKYIPYYYLDNNDEPTFIKNRKVRVLKSFTIKAHDQATADIRAYDYLEDKYPQIKKYILFK